jgi:predicted RNase H-like nuclease (RuvC/YqgF family)
MRLTRWLKTLALLAALCLAALPVLARRQASEQQPTGDPVADAARKAREQQKKEAKPKKVYTEDDLSRGRGSASDQSATSTGQQAPQGASENAQAGATAEANAAAEDKNDEKKWRKRFRDLREKITQSEKELDLLQRELDKAQVQYYPDPQKALMEQNDRKEIDQKTAKIDAKKKEIEQLNQRFSDLEDELRKSGGDPGWSR